MFKKNYYKKKKEMGNGDNFCGAGMGTVNTVEVQL